MHIIMRIYMCVMKKHTPEVFVINRWNQRNCTHHNTVVKNTFDQIFNINRVNQVKTLSLFKILDKYIKSHTLYTTVSIISQHNIKNLRRCTIVNTKIKIVTIIIEAEIPEIPDDQNLFELTLIKRIQTAHPQITEGSWTMMPAVKIRNLMIFQAQCHCFSTEQMQTVIWVNGSKQFNHS